MEILVNAIVGLVAAIIGAVVATLYQNKLHIKQIKIELITNILGFRYQLAEGYTGSQSNILLYLNQITTVFHKSSKVHKTVIQYKKDKTVESIVSLIKCMYDDVKIKYNYDDSVIDTPFSGKK